MTTFACDISEFQPVVNNYYPHPWLIFRSNDGTYQDQHFQANYNWARTHLDKLAGYTVYAVYRPGVDTFGTLVRNLGVLDKHVTVMIDVESWGGSIQGNHSTDINVLVNHCAALLGDNRRVLAYGNTGDLNSIYPVRPSWLRLVVASYGRQPFMKNMIGWQYTDDHIYTTPSGFPTSTAPFGRCDHNAFLNLTPQQLAVSLGVGPSADMEVDVKIHTSDPVSFKAHGWDTRSCWKTWFTADGAVHCSHVRSFAEWQILLKVADRAAPLTYSDVVAMGGHP